jgi:hypothetical protein
MRIGVTLNEVIRAHYETVNQSYELYTSEINQSLNTDELLETSEDDKLYLKEKFNFAGEVKNHENSPLVQYDLTNSEGLEDYEEMVDNRVRNLISVELLDDPMNITKLHKFYDSEEFQYFMYSENAFEIFARTPLMYESVMKDLNDLVISMNQTKHSVTVVSQERMNSQSATLLFLSQTRFFGNNINFCYDYSKIWEKYDVIVTADQYIAENVPPKKVCFLIKNEYNEYCLANERVYGFKKFGDACKELRKYKNIL